MLLIPCPYCGPRPDSEFVYGEDANAISHDPTRQTHVSPASWARSIYMRENPNGVHREYWFHQSGCRKWLLVKRDTGTNNEIYEVIAARHGLENH